MIRGGLIGGPWGGGRPGAVEAEAIIGSIRDIGGWVSYEVICRSMRYIESINPTRLYFTIFTESIECVCWLRDLDEVPPAQHPLPLHLFGHVQQVMA